MENVGAALSKDIDRNVIILWEQPRQLHDRKSTLLKTNDVSYLIIPVCNLWHEQQKYQTA